MNENNLSTEQVIEVLSISTEQIIEILESINSNILNSENLTFILLVLILIIVFLSTTIFIFSLKSIRTELKNCNRKMNELKRTLIKIQRLQNKKNTTNTNKEQE